MRPDYDYIIIGSGFGGSVSALRLAEKGYRVLVIEKGKWHRPEDFPKTNWNIRKWLWIPALRFFGIMKISFFKHISIVSGTGVGGGSLVYANTLPVPGSAFFNTGSWAGLEDWESVLKPFYDLASRMLGAARNPRLFDGDLALQQLAVKRGIADRFEHPRVGVFFGKPGVVTADPYFDGEGPDRTGCNFCGGCMTGCRFGAKNSLDWNYLYLAQRHGAGILAENEVVDVEPLDGKEGATGYRVTFRSSTRLFGKRRSFTANGVVFSGGVLGSVQLLLQLKKKSLPGLSDQIGRQVRTNNETLISVSTLNPKLDLSKGVAIGSLLHTDDHSHLEIVRYSEGSGFWKWLHLPLSTGRNPAIRLFSMFGRILSSPLAYCKIYWVNSWSKHTSVLLFMQSLDSTLAFRPGMFGKMTSALESGQKPSPEIPESLSLTREYAAIVQGKATSFSLETIAGIPSTAHILGGAVMGKDAESGVVNRYGEVFGYRNLRILDGSVISANPGVNPSLSITAIAEWAMDHIPDKIEQP